MNLATLLPLHRLCGLATVSRAGFYRWRHAPPVVDADLDLRDEIQRIALEWPCYGSRRVKAELRQRGWTVGRERVQRLMREDNLLCLRRRKVVVTTDSNHNRRVYPNLARDLVLRGINQLWVADITYIRLETEFVYLAVVIDACSRRVIGWALDRTVEDDLTVAALRMALEVRRPSPGLVHHSEFSLEDSSGKTARLSEYRGKVGFDVVPIHYAGDIGGCHPPLPRSIRFRAASGKAHHARPEMVSRPASPSHPSKRPPRPGLPWRTAAGTRKTRGSPSYSRYTRSPKNREPQRRGLALAARPKHSTDR